jgi:hypothetical protein
MNMVPCGLGFSPASKSVFWEGKLAKRGDPVKLLQDQPDRSQTMRQNGIGISRKAAIVELI